jgi:hypothetical protein
VSLTIAARKSLFGVTVPPIVVMSTRVPLAPLQSSRGQSTVGVTITDPIAVDVEFPPFLEVMSVIVRLASPESRSETSSAALLGKQRSTSAG